MREDFLARLTDPERSALACVFAVADQQNLDCVAVLLAAAAGTEGELRAALIGVLEKVEITLN